jgi:hypothetical protein
MSKSLVNIYLKEAGINFTKAPSQLISKNGNRYSYSPLGTVTNGSTRPMYQYRKDNTLEEMGLLVTACHVKTVLGWELHHLVAYSNGGSCNVENLCLLPKGLNYAIGPNDWTLDQINEFVSSLPPFAYKAYGIPKGFKALPLHESVKEASRWLRAKTIKEFEKKAVY